VVSVSIVDGRLAVSGGQTVHEPKRRVESGLQNYRGGNKCSFYTDLMGVEQFARSYVSSKQGVQISPLKSHRMEYIAVFTMIRVQCVDIYPRW
jgi:hypothetical protein